MISRPTTYIVYIITHTSSADKRASMVCQADSSFFYLTVPLTEMERGLHFPGRPVVETLSFQCRIAGFDPCSES